MAVKCRDCETYTDHKDASRGYCSCGSENLDHKAEAPIPQFHARLPRNFNNRPAPKREPDNDGPLMHYDDTTRKMVRTMDHIESLDPIRNYILEQELNKPVRTPGERKKFMVKVKGDNGNVKTVRFGDPSLEIRRDSDERRKSFRARHKCDSKKDKTTPGYWSCHQWRANAKVED